jgi:hypothetical protein
MHGRRGARREEPLLLQGGWRFVMVRLQFLFVAVMLRLSIIGGVGDHGLFWCHCWYWYLDFLIGIGSTYSYTKPV